MRDPDGLIRRWSLSNGSGGELVEHAAQIEPSIEAPLELGEVARNVRPADRVAGSSDCSLQVSEDSVHPAEADQGLGAACGGLGHDHGFVQAAGFGDGGKAGKPVGDDARGWRQMQLRDARDLVPVVGDDGHER